MRPHPAAESPSPDACITDFWASLLCETGRGDAAAFEHIVEHWKTPLFRFFLRSGLPAADAEELALQTLVQCYRAAPNYRPDRPFTAFLFRIARNALTSHFRKIRCRPVLVAVDESFLHSNERALEQPRRSEWEEIFQAALASLPEAPRTALLLHVQQELSYHEIAEALGLSLSAVKSAIHRARASVKQFMEETDHGIQTTR